MNEKKRTGKRKTARTSSQFRYENGTAAKDNGANTPTIAIALLSYCTQLNKTEKEREKKGILPKK